MRRQLNNHGEYVMNKVQIIYWVSGNGLDTVNRSIFIEMPTSEVTKEGFIDNAMARFRAANVQNWKEVINIINHGATV
jgi:hypothetical protein